MRHDWAEIVTMLRLCSRRGGARFSELCEQLERSPATVKRMIRTLRDLGVDLRCESSFERETRYQVHAWGIFDGDRIRGRLL